MSEYLITKQEAMTGNKRSAPKNKAPARFVGLINRQGRIIRSSHDCVASLDRRSQEMFFTEIALQTRMYADFDEHFDSVNYSLTERGQMKIVTIPLPDHSTIVVMMDKKEDHDKIIEEIRTSVATDSQNFGLNCIIDRKGE